MRGDIRGDIRGDMEMRNKSRGRFVGLKESREKEIM